MHTRKSGQMYLETILVLSKKSSFVRAVDMAEHTGLSKASVSRALKIMRESGFVAVDVHGAVSLTDKGLEIATKIYERHTVLNELLVYLGIDEKTANQDACEIEHVISDKTFEAIKRHYVAIQLK